MAKQLQTKKPGKQRKKQAQKTRRSPSSVAAANRRARMESLIDEAATRQYLMQIEEAVQEVFTLKKQIDDAHLNKEVILESILSFGFLDKDDLTEEEFKRELQMAIEGVIIAQQKHLTTVILKAEIQNKLSKTILDTNFRRLAKVFPDLKAIEFTDPEGKSPFTFASLIAATKSER